jgi:hypothetical protein
MSRARAGRLAAFILASVLLAGCLPTGPPAPSVGVIWTGYSFDTCAAPTTATMGAWAGQSPYGAIGIYVGGNSAACRPGSGSNPNLTSGWVGTVENQGWRLLPLYVGSQAPCSSFNHRIDPNNAPSQGVSEAEDAVAKASALGIGGGSPIYFDMEGYGRDPGCINAVTVFLNYWSARVHQLGYVSGLYSSASSGIADQVTLVANRVPGYNNPPDELWIARWFAGSGSCPKAATDTKDPAVPDSMWNNHQRHRQYCGGHAESYGGVAINIDSSLSDGMVAGR